MPTVSCRMKVRSPLPWAMQRKAPSKPAAGSLVEQRSSPRPLHSSHTDVGLLPGETQHMVKCINTSPCPLHSSHTDVGLLPGETQHVVKCINTSPCPLHSSHTDVGLLPGHKHSIWSNVSIPHPVHCTAHTQTWGCYLDTNSQVCQRLVLLEGNVLFNDALNTFYLRLYGVGHMVKDHSDSERGNLLLPHGLLFPISRKVFLYAPPPQTG